MKRVGIFLVAMLWMLSSWADEVKLPFVIPQLSMQADFNQPTAIATADDGRIFVLDGMNSRIVVFSQEGKQQAEIISDKTIPDFFHAVGLTWANGQLYIADTKNNRILILTDQGKFVSEIPLPILVPERNWPEPVALRIVNDRLIYTDRRNHRFCIIDLETDSKQKCFGQRGERKAEFQFPFQIAVDKDDYLHIVDVINGRVQVFNARGQYFSQEGEFAVDVLYRPNGIAIDALGYMYVSDAYLGTIAVFEKGHYRGTLKDAKGQSVKFSTPVGLWVDTNGLYVVDATTHSVYKLQLSYQLQNEEVLNIPRQSPDLSRKNCVACHFSWGFSDERSLKDKQGAEPVASLSMCYSCHHGVVFDSRQAIPHGGQHPTVYDKREEKQNRQKNLPRKDDIPEHHPLQNDGEMLCTACHTPHNPENEHPTLYVENSNSWMRVLNQDSELCEDCHKSKTKSAKERDKKLRGINHPLAFHMSRPAQKNTPHYSDDPHLQKGLPETLIKGGGMLGDKQQQLCQSCHQIHGGISDNLLAVDDKKGQLCGECHKRQFQKGLKGARKAGVHPVNVKLEKAVKFRGEKITHVVCQSCHSVHDGTLGTPLFPDRIEQAEKLCVACHERQHAKDDKDARKKGVHPVTIKLEEPVKVGGLKVKQMGCLSCHSVHNGKPNTPALREDHRNGALCENCHEGKQRVVGTNHDFRVTAKKSKNQFKESSHQSGVCGSCHSLHRGKGKQPYLNAAVIAKKKKRDDSAPKLAVDELCLNCHQKDGLGKEKPILHYGHPHKDMTLRSDSEKMPLLKKNTEKIDEKHGIGVIACITCHEPHTWEPIAKNKKKGYKVLNHTTQKNVEGNILNSFLRRKGVQKTFCVDCHSIEALAKYKYFHHKDKMRDIGVDYLH